MTCDTWDDFSKRSPKYIKGQCQRFWNTFSKTNLREATLWKWLREDNPDAYISLSTQREDFWSIIFNPSHAEVAHFFYNLKPNSYMWHPDLHWYAITPSNIWQHYNSQPSGLMNDIWETFRPLIREHTAQLDLTVSDQTDQGKKIKNKLNAALKFNKLSGDSRFAKGVMDYLPYNYYVADLDTKMDESRHLFAFSDSVWDFNLNKIRPITPDDYISINTGYPYPHTISPTDLHNTMTFIRSVFEPTDATTPSDTTQSVLRAIADKMNGNRRFQEFYILTGLGGNGKGLLRNLISRAFGQYYQEASHQVFTKVQDKQNSHSPEMALAKGKRILMVSEPDASDFLQVSILKQYTGNDIINARAPYARKPISYRAQFAPFIQCNQKPKLSKADGGVGRRVRVVMFPYQFKPHPDPTNIVTGKQIGRAHV